MKCQRCNKEMINTIGGCYHCPECGFAINDLVYRDGRSVPTDTTEQITPNYGLATTPSITDSNTATIPDWSHSGFVLQGWQCPKCGAILSPHTSFCPFCSPVFTQRIIYTTTNPPAQYINPNVTTTVSNNTK